MDIITLNSNFLKALEDNKNADANLHDFTIKFFNDNSIVFHDYLALESGADVVAYKELTWRYSDSLFKREDSMMQLNLF